MALKSTVTSEPWSPANGEFQVKTMRRGRVISWYEPVCGTAPLGVCMTISNSPPTRGSSFTSARSVSNGRIQRDELGGIEPGVEELGGGRRDLAADDGGGDLCDCVHFCFLCLVFLPVANSSSAARLSVQKRW